MRNIYLSYIITICQHAWFWTGIWVLYYLKFTDYAGIGLIETAMIISTTALDIPAGALADIIGRKKIIMLALLFGAIGNFLMGFANSFIFLLIATILPGRAFYSGAIESLTFDSLSQIGLENKFNKVISNINSLALFSIATGSILGGFIYKLNPRYPFFLCGLFILFGFIVSFWIKEPAITHQGKLDIKNYLLKIKDGTRHLFHRVNFRRMLILLITFGLFLTITEEILDYSLAIHFGFKEIDLGILFAVVYLFSSAASQLSKATMRFDSFKTISILIILFIISLIVSPIAGIFVGGTMVILRNAILPIFNNIANVEINNNVASQYRTTALSTFSMVKNLLYVLGAFLIGKFTDLTSASTVAVFLAVLLLILIIPQLYLLVKNEKS